MVFIPRFAEIWGPTSLSGSARALYRALVRPEGRASLSQYGEPTKLCQSKFATTSSARFISTSKPDKPPQKCGKARARLLSSKLSEDLTSWAEGIGLLSLCFRKLQHNVNNPPVNNIPAFGQDVREKRSGDFRLSPPANFANSAILPTDKISTFFMQNFLLQKPKDSSLLCPLTPTGEISTESRQCLARRSVRSGRKIT